MFLDRQARRPDSGAVIGRIGRVAARSAPIFTVERFIRGDQDVRSRVLTPGGELREQALHDGNVYHSPTVFQLKAILYHAGILTERGAKLSNLEPVEDTWSLREYV